MNAIDNGTLVRADEVHAGTRKTKKLRCVDCNSPTSGDVRSATSTTTRRHRGTSPAPTDSVGAGEKPPTPADHRQQSFGV